MEATYKVLWVDDDQSIVKGYQALAGLKNIELIWRSNWEEAYITIQKGYQELTAIILDANCKLNKSDKDLTENFLRDALDEFSDFCSKKQIEIPWYILSAGTMANFKVIIDQQVGKMRKEREDDWGAAVYNKSDLMKDKDCPLFPSIQKVGASQCNNIGLYRHREAFEYLGESSLIRGEAREIVLKALAAVYYPERNPDYEFNGNSLRQVLEYLFRSAKDKGLLPEELFKNGKEEIPILWHCMQYMCGKDVWFENAILRYGEISDTIFSERDGFIFRNILNFGNRDSHTESEKEQVGCAIIDKLSKELFYGLVFQLIHIIICYGRFVKEHPNKENNESKQIKIPSVIGKEGIVYAEEKFKYMDNVIIGDNRCKPGQTVRIEEAVLNNNKQNNDKFPFYAKKITPLHD